MVNKTWLKLNSGPDFIHLTDGMSRDLSQNYTLKINIQSNSCNSGVSQMWSTVSLSNLQ